VGFVPALEDAVRRATEPPPERFGLFGPAREADRLPLDLQPLHALRGRVQIGCLGERFRRFDETSLLVEPTRADLLALHASSIAAQIELLPLCVPRFLERLESLRVERGGRAPLDVERLELVPRGLELAH